MPQYRSTAAGAALAALLAGAPAQAANIFDPSVSTCTDRNCNAVAIHGTVLAPGRVEPFVIGLYARSGECVRIETVARDADLELVLVAPDGSFRRDDDGGRCTDCALVKLHTSVSGWHTLHVSPQDGSAISVDFTLRYGRYDLGNPNCATPTAASAAPVERAAARPRGGRFSEFPDGPAVPR